MTIPPPRTKPCCLGVKKPSNLYPSGVNRLLLTSTITPFHQRSYSETSVTGGIHGIPLGPAHPALPAASRVTNGQCASAALSDINSCVPALESPAVSVSLCRTWGHLPCPRQDAQLSPPTLGLRLKRHSVHILASLCCVWPLVLLMGCFPKSARTGSRNPADPQGRHRPPTLAAPHQTPPGKTKTTQSTCNPA